MNEYGNNMDQMPIVPPGGQVALKTKKFGKTPLIIAAAAAAIVAIVVIVVSVVGNSPMALVGKGAANSFDAMQKNEVISLVSDTMKGGSVELLYDFENLPGMSMDGGISAKVYTNYDKNEAAFVTNIEMDGDPILDVTAVMDQKDIAVKSDVLFGKNAYGISLKNLSKNFDNSVFGPDGEFSLGIELPDSSNSILEDSTKLAEQGKKVSEDMLKELTKTLKKNAEIAKENESLDFNGNSVKTTAVKVQLDSEGLAAVAEDMVNYVSTDKDLKTYLYDYADYTAMIMEEMGLVYGYYDEGSEAIDDFYDAMEDMSDAMEDLAEELEDAEAEMVVTFYITKSGKELVGLNADVESYGDRVRMSAIAGPSWKELEEIEIRVDNGYSDDRISYVVDVNDKNEYSAELKVREDGDSVMTAEINWDKKKGDFEVEMDDGWSTYTVEGTLKMSSKQAEIVVDSIGEDSYEMDLGMCVNVKASDKMPSMPSYTDVLKMSEDDVEELLYDLEDVVADLSYMLYFFL